MSSVQHFGGVEEFGGVAEEPKVCKRARRINRPDEVLHHESLATTGEVAQYLRVHPKTVERLRRLKGLPCLRIGGRIRYVLSDVTRWASAQEVANAEAP
jgi:excisionase family DNA binding protein